MSGRNTSGAHTYEQLTRTRTLLDVFAEPYCKWRVASIESNCEQAAAGGSRVAKALELLQRQTWWLLDEHGLSGAQPAPSQFRVTGMSRSDYEEPCVRRQGVFRSTHS